MTKFLEFVIGVGVGVSIIYYNQTLVKLIGRSSGAERVFGPAGTYTLYKVIGLVVIAFTVLYTIGGLDRLLTAIFSFLGGGAA